MPKLVSFREYARHRGVVLSAVQYAIKAGRIKVHTDENGKRGLDKDEADRDWALNTDPVRQTRGAARQAHIGGAPSEPQPEGSELKGRPTFADAKLQREIANAEMARLDMLERKGKLVSADEVKAESYRVARQVRDSLMNIPERVSAEIAAAFGVSANEPEVYKILATEIRRALEGLAYGEP